MVHGKDSNLVVYIHIVMKSLKGRREYGSCEDHFSCRTIVTSCPVCWPHAKASIDGLESVQGDIVETDIVGTSSNEQKSRS